MPGSRPADWELGPALACGRGTGGLCFSPAPAVQLVRTCTLLLHSCWGLLAPSAATDTESCLVRAGLPWVDPCQSWVWLLGLQLEMKSWFRIRTLQMCSTLASWGLLALLVQCPVQEFTGWRLSRCSDCSRCDSCCCLVFVCLCRCLFKNTRPYP